MRARLPPEQRRRQLVDAALRCLAAEGPSVPSARIAAEAGVSEALVHHYFPTREALWLAVATRAGSFAERLAVALGTAREPGALLTAIGDAFISLPDEEREALTLLHGAAARADALGALVRRGHRDAADQLGAALAATGALRDGVEPGLAGMGLVAGLLQFLTLSRDAEPESWAKASRTFVDAWIRAWSNGVLAHPLEGR